MSEKLKRLSSGFLITTHAKQRINERLGCNIDKIKKLTVKAWYSKEPIRVEHYNNKEYHRGYRDDIVYKRFMGYVWIFETHKSRKNDFFTVKKLVTIY